MSSRARGMSDLETREAEWLEAAARRARAQAAYEERFIDKRISQQAKDQTVKSNEITGIDLEIQIYNKRKEFEDLQKPAPEPQPKKKTPRGRSPKQKRREEVFKRYDKEIARIEAMKATAKAKASLTKAAEAEKEKELEEIEKEP